MFSILVVCQKSPLEREAAIEISGFGLGQVIRLADLSRAGRCALVEGDVERTSDATGL